jgi:O-antigen ligase
MSRFMDMTTDPSAYAGERYPPESETLVTQPQPGSVPRKGVLAKSQERFGFFQWALLVYLFFYCSRMNEVVGYLRFAVILLPILAIGLYYSGRYRAVLHMRSGKALIAFTFWIAACVPTSLWRSDSLNVLKGAVIALFVTITMAALIRTVRDCYRVMYTIGVGMATIAIVGSITGRTQNARLGAGGSSSLSDPNFFCFYVMVGICFLAASASVQKGLQRLLSLGLIVICLTAAARTGSRMGLLAFAVATVAFFIFGTERQKIYMLVITFVMVVAVPPLLPQSVRDHLLTFFQPSSQQATNEEVIAAESTAVRKVLLYRSLQFTYENPIFGVGPGQFVQAEQQLATRERRRPLWFYPHNAYTETSCETGIPGFLLFVVAFFGAQLGLRSIRKHNPDRQVRNMALYLHLALIIATVCAAFLTLGYAGLIWILIAVSGTFQMAVARQTKLARAARQAATSA